MICYSGSMSKHALWLALSLLACSCSGDEGVDCNPVLRWSVIVRVVDAAGEPVADAVVKYSLEGLPERSCMSTTDGTYYCAQEEQGRFVITAVRGDERGEARVNVRADVCHVVPENVTLTLEAAS